ncbi:uncharacterized protein LOC128389428 [Panonychus citri]|uniref:uncharacterized protein LOC128389428 n=1 Tax=Panonychus citri TaxID=50023 RepID=UPI002306ECB8|nr:uncharacterized protein LOC128389428 [Panonychus citri]
MNFPTTTNPETNTSKHNDWPESDIWSEHSYGYTQSSHFRPFGNRAGSQSGVLMVEDPGNERDNRTREPSPDSKQLVEIVRELRKSNEELKTNNQLLNQKLEQTNQLVQQGFKSIRDAISNIPGQVSQNINNSIVNSPSNEKACWPIAQWTRTSESSSIISSLPEDLADEIEELHFNPVTLPEPSNSNYSQSLITIGSTVATAATTTTTTSTTESTMSDNKKEEIKKLSQTMKEKFGLEYDEKLDFNIWLRK